MKGLLKKDCTLLKSVALPIIAIMVMLAVAGVVEYIDVIYTLILWSLIIITAIFNQDRFYRMDEFVSSIPDGKTKSVKSKYVLAVMLVLGLSLVSLIVAGIYTRVHVNFDYRFIPVTILATMAFAFLGFALFLPLTYRVGILKTSFLSGLWSVAGMLFLFISSESEIIKLLGNYTWNTLYLSCGLMIFASLCILYVSYILSIKWYLKRER